MLLVLSVAFRSMAATVIPVSSMAIGDIQLPEVVMTESSQPGTGREVSPMTMPINIPMNIGLTKDFRLSFRDTFFSSSHISRAGTPHR